MPEITGATDLDVLTQLFHVRQERKACEAVVDEAKTALKAAKEVEAKLLDELGGHIMRRRDELNMPRLDIPGLNPNLDHRDDIPPEER